MPKILYRTKRHAKILTAANSFCFLHLALRAVANESLKIPFIVAARALARTVPHGSVFKSLYIQILNKLSVFNDEFTAGLNTVSHKN